MTNQEMLNSNYTLSVSINQSVTQFNTYFIYVSMILNYDDILQTSKNIYFIMKKYKEQFEIDYKHEFFKQLLLQDLSEDFNFEIIDDRIHTCLIENDVG